jgi:heme a synthase
MGFSKIATYTLIAVFLLILVGGIVRSTGAGMGCPDWPKCFGRWVPPTSMSELPLNYQEIYGAKLKGEVVFNVTKTWTEYLNRLLGVVIGILVTLTFVASCKYWTDNKKITILSFLALLLTVLQGWLGARVVFSELKHSAIHIHLLMAIVIVFVLIASIVEKMDYKSIGKIKSPILIAGFVVTAIQIVFGTQVRSEIDNIAKLLGDNMRHSWVENLGLEFYIHRSFSVVVILVLFLYYKHVKNNWGGVSGYINILNNALGLLILTEILIGIYLTYGGFSSWFQPFHLLLGILALSIQFMFLYLNSFVLNKVSNG